MGSYCCSEERNNPEPLLPGPPSDSPRISVTNKAYILKKALKKESICPSDATATADGSGASIQGEAVTNGGVTQGEAAGESSGLNEGEAKPAAGPSPGDATIPLGSLSLDGHFGFGNVEADEPEGQGKLEVGPTENGQKDSNNHEVGGVGQLPQAPITAGENVDLQPMDKFESVEVQSKLRKSKTRTTIRTSFKKAGDDDDDESHLPQHKVSKELDAETRALVMESMKKDRICQQLDDVEINLILDSMEFYKFEAGTVIVTQGALGDHFFVTEQGSLEVSMDDHIVNTLHAGSAFGGLALLYRCPRTATVTAKETACLWGAAGKTFKNVLMEHAEKNSAYHRAALSQIKLFAGLPDKEKDLLATALFTEFVEAEARVVTEGEVATGMYLVQKGSLRVLKGGETNQDGVLVNGKEVRILGPGDHFGEKAMITHEVRTATVVAAEKSHLLGISAATVEAVLGTDLRSCLDRHINLSCFKKSPMFSGLTFRQLAPLLDPRSAHGIVARDLKPNESLDNQTYVFLSVIEGDVTLEGQDSPLTLSVGQFAEVEWTKPESKSCKIVAGAEGARLGILTQENLRSALVQLGISHIDQPQKALDFLPNLALISKIPIFRNLSQYQLGMVAESMQLQRFNKGDQVLKRGDVGTSLYIVHHGALNVMVDDHVVDTIGHHDFLGERGLFLGEPRSANVEVSSEHAELWCIEKSACMEFMTDKVKQDLVRRIALENTNVELKTLKHIKVIGQGDFGVVRLVECTKTGVFYSLKRLGKLAGNLTKDAEREAKTLEDLAHPFVMHVVKEFDTPKSIYILTELITGGGFRTAFVKRGGVLTQSEAQFYMGCVTLVLEVMSEKRILHRDIKPENILLDMQGYPKVINFTHSKKLRFASSRSFTLFGTPHYMAPEVVRGRGYSIEVDLWSTGVMMYELMCGTLPFGNDSTDPTEIWADTMNGELTFPDDFTCEPAKRLLEGLLTKDPRSRLGGGSKAVEDIKTHAFFMLANESENALFEVLMGREVDAPLPAASLVQRLRGLLTHSRHKASAMEITKSLQAEHEGLFSDAEELWQGS